MIKLKPCPYCGGEAEFERVGTARVSTIVSCTECGATLESGEVGEIAGASWNIREADNQLAKANERVKELEWTLCNLDAFKKSFSAITYTDKNKVFSSYREDTDFSEDLEPVVLQYLLEKGE